MKQKEKLAKNSEILEKYESGLGIPGNLAPGEEEELQGYLSWTRDVIEHKDAKELIGASLRLSQYSFYIQRCLNRNRAIIKYAEHEMNKIVSGEIRQYDKFTKHDVKVYQIAKENSAAAQLLEIKLYAEQVVERLTDLAANLKNLSYTFSLVYKHKMSDRNE